MAAHTYDQANDISNTSLSRGSHFKYPATGRAAVYSCSIFIPSTFPSLPLPSCLVLPKPGCRLGKGRKGEGAGSSHPIPLTQAVNTIHDTATDSLHHSHVQEIPDK